MTEETKPWMDPDYVRPSSLKFKNLCPNWTQNEDDEERTAAADTGTRLHLAMETGNTDPLDEEDLPLYNFALAQLEKLYQEYPGDREVFTELKLTTKYKINGQGQRYLGCIDRLEILGKGALLIDYKFGEWEVDAPEHNWQIRDYACKVFDRFPELEWIAGFIISPKLYKVSRGVFYREDVPLLKRKLSGIRVKAKMNREYPNRFCHWCSRLGTDCKAAETTLAKTELNGQSLPVLQGEWSLTEPMDLKKALEIRTKVNAFAHNFNEAVKSAALEMLEQGYDLEPFYMIERKGRRKITQLGTLMDLAQQVGVQPDELSDKFSVSMKAVLDLVKSKFPRGQKGNAAEKFLDDLRMANAIEYAESYPVIERRKE